MVKHSAIFVCSHQFMLVVFYLSASIEAWQEAGHTIGYRLIGIQL